ncbi:hypothetical protein RND71_032050 [Anisodus tanguticus]|uniref:Uncharacterized protein n=1 Tax=Anisodus tanguticus TaxID=243964 RepID=A0AAE1RBV8_9SOLA|nr:hypothetical protein RND71_032050 [Anisodus tanguticus]
MALYGAHSKVKKGLSLKSKSVPLKYASKSALGICIRLQNRVGNEINVLGREVIGELQSTKQITGTTTGIQTWASVTTGKKLNSKGMAMNFVALLIIDGVKFAQLDLDDIEKENEKWSNADHKEFIPLISAAWKNSIEHTSMIEVWKKSKKVKQSLKTLNSAQFKGIGDKIKLLRQQLQYVQEQIGISGR